MDTETPTRETQLDGKAKRLSDWINSSTRPEWMRAHPVAALIVAILINNEADIEDYSISIPVLAKACCCGETLVKDERDILAKQGWIKSKKGTSANWYSLTDKYLDHLGTKIEISEDAKAFMQWFEAEQQRYWDDVDKWNRIRAKELKRETGRHFASARILAIAGTPERAKRMARYAFTRHRKSAVQSLTKLMGVLNQASFASEFHAYEKSPTPITPEPTETPAQKLKRLVDEYYNRPNSQAAEEAAARHAMSMGLDPHDASKFPLRATSAMKYQPIWTQEYQSKEGVA